MEKIDLTVRLFEGFGNIDFGIRTPELVELLGEADSVEEITDEDDEEQTFMHTYEELLTSFFISGEDQKKILTSCDTENPDTLMFGNKVFEMNEQQIIDMFKEKELLEYETAKEEWGETRLSFPELLCDFYLQDGKVISLTWGFRFEEE